MKSTNSEIDSRIGKRKWMKGKILSRAVTLALALGLSGFFYGGISYAAQVKDSTAKGGVVVNLGNDKEELKLPDASGYRSVAAGWGAVSSGPYSVAIGNGSTVNTPGSIAIGKGALVKFSDRSDSREGNSIVIGTGSEAGQHGSNNIAIGTFSQANFINAVSIGNKSKAVGISSLAIGDNAQTSYQDAVALGHDSHAKHENSIALGHSAVAETRNSVTIGGNALASSLSSIAIGYYSNVNQSHSLALGAYSSTQGIDVSKDSVAKYSGEKIKKYDGVISVGTAAYTAGDGKKIEERRRRIVNVAGGINDNDAVNVAQLTAIANKIGTGNQYISIKAANKSNGATKVTGSGSIAIGDGAKSDTNQAITIGVNSQALERQITKDGKVLNETPSNAIAIGTSSLVQEQGSLAIGNNSQAWGTFSTSLGNNTMAVGWGTVALGHGSRFLAQQGIAIGQNARGTVEAENGIVIGYEAQLGYAKFDDDRVASRNLVDLKAEFEQLQKTPTALTQNQQYGNFSAIDGSDQSDDKPSVPTNSKGEPIKEVSRGAITIGEWSAASGYNAVAMGSTTRAYGSYSVALGSSSKALLDDSVAIGNTALATKARSTAIGRFAMTEAKDSVAIGTWARVTDNNSVSLGKYSSTQGTALEKDTKSAFIDDMVSKDAGVISVGTNEYEETLYRGTIGSDKNPITESKYKINDIKRRIVNVAGGINDNDAVNVKQLTTVANTPVYFYSGGITTDKAVKDSDGNNYTLQNIRLAFMDGISAQTVKEGDNSIVKVTLDKTYLDRLDEAVKKAEESATAAKGSEDKAKESESSADKSAQAARESATNAGNSADVAKERAEAADKSAQAAKESETNAGESAEAAKESENKAQEYADKAQKLVESNGAGNVNGHDGSTAIGKDSGVDSDNGTVIGQGASVGKDADGGTAIGQGAKVEEGAENSVAIGKDSVADKPNTVSVGSKGNERTITNVAPGRIEEGSTDAVNGGQLYDVSQRVGDNTRAISNLQDESRKGDAMNAALAALKPIGYNPAEPAQIMAGVGTYRGQQAIALGAAYYIDGSTMVNGGLAYAGDNHLMANAGVTWRIGSGSVPAEKVSSAGEVKALNERVQVLEATVEEQKKQIEELIALLQKK